MGIPETQAGVVVTLGFVHCVILQPIQMNTLLYFVVFCSCKIDQNQTDGKKTTLKCVKGLSFAISKLQAMNTIKTG